MAATPDSSGLFLSSSPIAPSSDLSEEVNVRVTQARRVAHLDPAIELIITTQRRAFFETFGRRVNLIRSRSQAFQDCHVTVFDKVLLELTQNGNATDNAAAVHYFCEEFLAIPMSAPHERKAAALSDAILTSVLNLPTMTPPLTQRESVSARGGGEAGSKSPDKKSFFGHSFEDVNEKELTALAAEVGESMPRLWSIYVQAKQEFHAVTDPYSFEKQDAAKFLRDTAENTLQYLENKEADQRLLDEVQINFENAKRAAMSLHGGRKRKFDSRGPYKPDLSVPRTWIHRSESNKDRRAADRYERSSRTHSSRATRQQFPGHTRAVAQYRESEGLADASADDQSEDLDLSPPHRGSKRRSKEDTRRPQPGRGHSNIPFGYSRAVDSYHPEN